MDKLKYLNPDNNHRIFKLVHSSPVNLEEFTNQVISDGFGGIVHNADWHTDKDDTKKYLCEDKDFSDLDIRLEYFKNNNLGLWLYDEKGYPSGSADGLTLDGHPEYEAMGFTFINTNGNDYNIEDKFIKIIYACKNDGSPVEFSDSYAVGADICYVVKPVYENSHAEKCGWGPRRYPNLMDKTAIKAFIACTYDRYYEKLKNFDVFEAVFTDEPSLMSGYVNCYEKTEYVFLPWQENLPNVFYELNGYSLFDIITELFDTSDTFKLGKLHFWQTVAHMVNEAYFVQISNWCRNHNMAFSGHCLLEECINNHVPLYGNLMKCLKSFDYPGVDMLVGSPVDFRKSVKHKFANAAKYVGSAARMTGNTKRVMVEICPLAYISGKEEYTLEEEIGTMDLIYMCGINHINSYLSPERLNGRFREYADYFGRVAYALDGAVWDGKIAVYYPIENIQGYYHPDYIGMNTFATITPTEQKIEDTIFDLYSRICESKLDYTFIDSDWILSAEINEGMLSMNNLKITAVVMPAMTYIDEKTLLKLKSFVDAGGKVIWEKCKPDCVDDDVVDNSIDTLKSIVDYGLIVEANDNENIFVSPLIKDGKRLWYVINSSDKECEINVFIKDGSSFDVMFNDSGEILPVNSFVLKAYTSVFVYEK